MTTEKPTRCFPCLVSCLPPITTNARLDDTPQPKVYCTAVPIAGLLPQRVVRAGRRVVSEQPPVGVLVEG